MTLFLSLFLAGIVTILLPCILPLIPIVLGVSISGRSKWRPLVTIAGMVVSFVLFTFIIQVALSQFVTLANIIQIATYYILLLFGICFLSNSKFLQIITAILGALFFWGEGIPVVMGAGVLGVIAIEVGGRVAGRIQQLGSNIQQEARSELGTESLLTAFIVGLTLGLVWVPCAGPALGFALTLVRDEPGIVAIGALLAYGLGAAVPLLLIAYGGQAAVHSARAIAAYSGRIKQVAGAILIIAALGFQYGWLMRFQVWITNYVPFGDLGTKIEQSLFQNPNPTPNPNPTSMELPKLPKLVRAPEFKGLGPWHNSEPFTLASLKGKVVLIDFWTYSCINCIRTLPYIKEYWEKFGSTSLTTGKDKPFVLLGVHTPEFVFEKSEKNVAAAIKNHGLTYPIAQDNDFATWNAFSNRYWPAKYLIDAEGYIRYTHFGEGAYDETDLAIQSLLKEIGMTSTGAIIGGDAEAGGRRDRSPEIYLGARSWPAFVNAEGDPDDDVHSYEVPTSLPLHTYALDGEWQLVDEEHQRLRSPEGEIHMQALGSEVNLVLGLHDAAKPVEADIIINGKKTSTITIDRHDLYNLYQGPYGQHLVTLKLKGPGVEAYAFTFGG